VAKAKASKTIVMARGMKATLESGSIAPSWPLVVYLRAKEGGLYEGYCFCLGEADKLISYDYMVSSSHKISPKGEIVFRDLPPSLVGKDSDFSVELSLLPAEARKLVFVVSLVGGGTMADAGELMGLVCQGPRHPGVKGDDFQIEKEGGAFSAFFKGSEFTTERAVIVFELYLEEVWRLAAVGSGYEGGIAALMSLYGPLDAAGAGQGLSSPLGSVAPPLSAGASLSGSPADLSSSSKSPAKGLEAGGQAPSHPLGNISPEELKGTLFYGPGGGLVVMNPSGSSPRPPEKPEPKDPEASKGSPPPGQLVWPPQWLGGSSDAGGPSQDSGGSSQGPGGPSQGLGWPHQSSKRKPSPKLLELSEVDLLSMIGTEPSNWDLPSKAWLNNSLDSLDTLKPSLLGQMPRWVEEVGTLLRGLRGALISAENFNMIYKEKFRVVLQLTPTIYNNPSFTIDTIDELFKKVNKMSLFFTNQELDIIVDSKKLIWNPDLTSEHDLYYTIDAGLISSHEPSHSIIDKISKMYLSSKIPVFVLFVTDSTIIGQKSDFCKSMAKCSGYPIFYHFLFTEKKHKVFLSNLANIKSKFTNNWWYSMMKDSWDLDDSDFHRRILWKFPEWILEMRSKKVIR
jgi:stress response protein SCP2